MGAYDERKTMEDLIRENADRFDPILRQLQADNWIQMDGAERLDLLRELENLMADLQGRPPMQINIMPEEYRNEHPDTAGYCSDDEIALAPEYFENITTGIPGIDQFTVWDAVDTIFHEGRHAWQRFMVKEFPETASPEVLMSMLMNSNRVIYVNSDIDESVYYLQTVELDARKYALNMLMGIQAYAEQQGLDNTGIGIQLFNSIELEKYQAAVGIALTSSDYLEDFDAIAISRAREAIDQNVFGWDEEKLEKIKQMFEQYVESGEASMFGFWRNAYQDFEAGIYRYIVEGPAPFYDTAQLKQESFKDARTRLLEKLDKMDRFGAAAKKGFSEKPDTGLKA